jgi:hypothetical protein
VSAAGAGCSAMRRRRRCARFRGSGGETVRHGVGAGVTLAQESAGGTTPDPRLKRLGACSADRFRASPSCGTGLARRGETVVDPGPPPTQPQTEGDRGNRCRRPGRGGRLPWRRRPQIDLIPERSQLEHHPAQLPEPRQAAASAALASSGRDRARAGSGPRWRSDQRGRLVHRSGPGTGSLGRCIPGGTVIRRVVRASTIPGDQLHDSLGSSKDTS